MYFIKQNLKFKLKNNRYFERFFDVPRLKFKVFKGISKEKSHNLINLIPFFLKEKRRAYVILISVSINSSKKEPIKNIRE